MSQPNELRLVLCVLCLALPLAACAGDAPAPVPSPAVMPAGATAAPTHAPSPAPAGETPPACLTAADLAAMDPASSAALAEFCFLAEDGTMTTIPQAQAVDTIRMTLDDPDREVVFQGMGLMPNSPNGDLHTAVFRDARGSDYFVALTANKLVEVTAPTDGAPLGTGALPEAELRRRAEALVTRGLPSFTELAPRLEDLSGTKGDLAFYRWEASDCMAWTSMPPLAQVGITSGGEVFSYINTLFYCQ